MPILVLFLNFNCQGGVETSDCNQSIGTGKEGELGDRVTGQSGLHSKNNFPNYK
jgi:hypothetical protein